MSNKKVAGGPGRLTMLLRLLFVRARFVGLFVGTAMIFIYWTTIENYYAKWTRPAAEAAGGSDVEFYCPMCPQVLRDEMDTCPICMMPLSKRKKTEAVALPEGVLARVNLTEHQIALAGVRVAEVQHCSLVKTIRTMGFVEVDERRLARIAARVSGRIEKVYVDFTGKEVVAEAPLVDIYSPELSVAVKELLLAKEAFAARGDDSNLRLFQSARQKLNLWGMSEWQIDGIVRDGAAAHTLTIPAPKSGVVLAKSVVEGQYVQEGSPLYEIADLSTVWLKARVYEDQLPFVALGQQVQATCSAYPGRTFRGEVAFIDPVVDRRTRTVNVRFDLDNAGGELRPGMYVTAAMEVPLTEVEPFKAHAARVDQGPKGTDDESLIAYQAICPVTKMKLGSMGKPVKLKVGDRTVFLCCLGCERAIKENPQKYLPNITPRPTDGILAIPVKAVIDTGARKIVYRQSQPGVFEAIEVVLGPRIGDSYPVVSGLYADDRIAAAGAFLIDAETRLNPAAATAYFGATGNEQTTAETPTTVQQR